MDHDVLAASLLNDSDELPQMQDHLQSLILARHKLICVHSTDEAVEFQAVLDVARRIDRTVQDWTVTTGVRVFAPDVDQPAAVTGTSKPEHAMQYFLRQKRPAIACLRGAAPFMTQPVFRRLIQDFVEQADGTRECLLLIDAETIPPRIQRLAVSWRPGLPDRGELRDIVRETYRRIRKSTSAEVVSELRKFELEQMVLNLRGLTRSQAVRVIESVILDDRKLSSADLQGVIDAKRSLLESHGSLEAMTIDFDIDEVGGLRGLKRWLTQRRGGFSEKAREFGITPPRGVLMLGIPGCGKSLCAKAVAADWGMPLLRLDPGVLYQKFIGESESQLREAIRQAEAMSPVVLWIDEIEKAFASASSSSADGGLSQRMFGTLLSWMQDHREPIFMVATANDISALPPELLRKGRFDEVFFIDLPSVPARRQIFQIHLKRRNRDPQQFRIAELADAAQDLTGSEIEQAIVSGLFHAFSENRELKTEDILGAIQETHPLSRLMREKIEFLRSWAEGRCVAAD